MVDCMFLFLVVELNNIIEVELVIEVDLGCIKEAFDIVVIILLVIA